MIGIVVVTHAGLAGEMCHAAELILGPLEDVDAISIDRDMSIDEAREQLEKAIGHVGHQGQGVLILTDLFGGTPTNISSDFLKPGEVEILTGVNLPMLIKCVGGRSGKTLEELAIMIKDYGCKAIMRPAELLNRS